MKEQLQKVAQLLDANKFCYDDIYEYGILDVICILVEDGDWKHEHLALDWLMEENGYYKVNEIDYIGSDGDWYTSTHCYVTQDREEEIKRFKEMFN